jgi:GNAT superfamily N-acetyltransferase
MSYTIRSLDAATWAAFAELAERNDGIFGGCWCIGYHPECGQREISHRAVKEDRVRTGRAHAALVLDENGDAQGWCQYGSPEELPGIKHRREYEKDAPPRPDWRITCFYVDKKHRGQGIARAALEGALDQADRRLRRRAAQDRGAGSAFKALGESGQRELFGGAHVAEGVFEPHTRRVEPRPGRRAELRERGVLTGGWLELVFGSVEPGPDRVTA